MSVQSEVGRAIDARRVAIGMTKDRLAILSSMNPSHLHDVIRGKTSPTVRTLERLAAALGTDVYGLFRTAYRIKEQVH